eukprot:gnl/TRDRNA2_/TRDRNA2_169162_c0_seq1.p1 gnl/TRDRNA2_/TRDRNA2_169162_c0~~gnl/TRDRNA2_/TRDRNA2_169162_c0_seq1.p1  ORF type:complete len:139 (+),score=13.87 gnl/TRDRNA2_/TRDRNA2_169162_c0_seq1:347-763(+)
MGARASSVHRGAQELAAHIKLASQTGERPLVIYAGDFNSRFARRGASPPGLQKLSILDVETAAGSRDWWLQTVQARALFHQRIGTIELSATEPSARPLTSISSLWHMEKHSQAVLLTTGCWMALKSRTGLQTRIFLEC